MIQAKWGLPRTTRAGMAVAAGTLLLVLALVIVFRNRLIVPGALAAGLAFAAFSFVWPLPLLTIEMFFSTSAFKFVGAKQYPHVIPFLPLDPPDYLVLFVFALGVLKLVLRRERPMFLGPLLFFGAMAALSAILGPVAGSQSLFDSLNGVRQLSGYLFYFGLVGLIDTPRRLRGLTWVLYAFVVVSVGIQLLEVLRGQQFTTAFEPFNEYYAGDMMVSVGTLAAPYLWNRIGGYLLVGLFLAFNEGLWTGSLRAYLLAAVAASGYVVQLIRQWFVFLALGALLSLVLLRRGRMRVVMSGATLATLLAIAVGLVAANAPRNLPGVRLLGARLGTIVRAADEPNFVFRLQTWGEQLRLFRQHPLFGWGPGSSNRLGESGGSFVFFDTDTGMSNTLLQYGLFGTAAVWVLIGAFYYHAIRLFRALPDSRLRGQVAGLLAAWTVMVIGYLTSQDFFTATELAFTAALVLALLDRFRALARMRMREEAGRTHDRA